jgi:hypothetical protein
VAPYSWSTSARPRGATGGASTRTAC